MQSEESQYKDIGRICCCCEIIIHSTQASSSIRDESKERQANGPRRNNVSYLQDSVRTHKMLVQIRKFDMAEKMARFFTCFGMMRSSTMGKAKAAMYA